MTKDEKKKIEKVIDLLSAPEMDYHEAMIILVELVGRKIKPLVVTETVTLHEMSMPKEQTFDPSKL